MMTTDYDFDGGDDELDDDIVDDDIHGLAYCNSINWKYTKYAMVKTDISR